MVLCDCMIFFSSILIPILLSVMHVMQFLSSVNDWLDSFALRKLVDPRKLLLKGICPSCTWLINCITSTVGPGAITTKVKEVDPFAAHHSFDQFSVRRLQLLKRLEC